MHANIPMCLYIHQIYNVKIRVYIWNKVAQILQDSLRLERDSNSVIPDLKSLLAPV